ncbi:MAG: redoxin family protein [Lentisphaeraceae bacterium]|nr:redoxin family protein [Lentisphaeraceae bacterium]
MKAFILLLAIAGSYYYFTEVKDKGKTTKTRTRAVGGSVASQLSGILVNSSGKKVSPKLSRKKYFVFYYSASWCPPCQKFTPDLVKFYNRNKNLRSKYEIILVSSDRSERDQLSYMKKKHMNFPAVKFSEIAASRAKAYMGGRGIPHLSMVDAKGNVLVDEVAWNAMEKIEKILKKKS